MKNFVFFIVVFIVLPPIFSQPLELPIGLTEEEKTRIDEIHAAVKFGVDHGLDPKTFDRLATVFPAARPVFNPARIVMGSIAIYHQTLLGVSPKTQVCFLKF